MFNTVPGQLERFEVQLQHELSGDWEMVMEVRPAHRYEKVLKRRFLRKPVLVEELVNAGTALQDARCRAVLQAGAFKHQQRKPVRVKQFFRDVYGHLHQDVVWKDGIFSDR